MLERQRCDNVPSTLSDVATKRQQKPTLSQRLVPAGILYSREWHTPVAKSLVIRSLILHSMFDSEGQTIIQAGRSTQTVLSVSMADN